MLRFKEATEIIISEDTTTNPKFIRLKEAYEDIDLTNLAEVVSRQETFPIGTHAINLNNIAEGRFIYVKPITKTGGQVQLEINGSNALTLRNGKATKLWTIFASINLIVSGQSNEVLVVLAGE